ncbi:Gfo/Idh/MocA family protein [Segeticoccus rhizosphaerae]|uniref:Gfo/Idh/MocA family protein n=1 Tax=Segeticoccus rhizosphaerae TaxID=1104777 RepID=UPI0023AFFA2C|nr:Gfo/Idh/MocA family oxidoreductase [Segeticoccus rhizosphaerae]
MHRTRVGVIGAGVMGTAYASAMTSGTLAWRCELVGIADTNPDAAHNLAGRVGCAAYNSPDDLLSQAHPDAVYIAVPDRLHLAPFLTAAHHGVAILVEKPLATTLEDALAMQEAARAAHVVARVNFSNRFNPPFVRAREAIDRGDLGEVIGVSARLSNVIDYPTKHLRWADRTTCGWFLLSHLFDLVRWLAGAEADRVTAAGVKRRLASMGLDTYDLIHALVEYEGGLSGAYESAWVLPPSLPSLVDCNVQIVGTDGRALIDTHSQTVHIATQQHLSYPATLDWTDASITSFLDAADLGVPVPPEQLADGVENTRLLVALHQSLETGAPVPVVREPAQQ